jgi:hypothetical protein
LTRPGVYGMTTLPHRIARVDDLGLEIIGEVTDLGPGESPAPKPAQVLRIRDSHHRIAMLVAKGYAAEEVSAMTGTGLSRIYTLARDPSFKELVRFYLNADGDVHRDLMVKMEDIARDAFEELHTRLQEQPDTLTPEFVLDLAKVSADRAGFAPVQRTINKSLHMTIGARYDRAESRTTKSKKDAA